MDYGDFSNPPGGYNKSTGKTLSYFNPTDAKPNRNDSIVETNSNIQQILTTMNSNMLVGDSISGKEFSKLNPKLWKADYAINSIDRTKNGFQLNLSLKGILIVKIIPELSRMDGAHFILSNVSSFDNLISIQVSSDDALYEDGPFKLIINQNNYLENNGHVWYPIFKS